MDLPAWDDTSAKYGTKIRVALWLVSVVGEGNLFTKAQLRDAFPGVEQVDRRMRDLRPHGWQIMTNKEDASLSSNELRFLKAGEEVWDPQKSSPVGDALSNKQRMAVFAGDDFMCVVCGIAGGETYAESSHETAQLTVTRRTVEGADGESAVQYVTECRRCKSGASVNRGASLPELIDSISVLDAAERETLAIWVAAGRRRPTTVERIWSEYRRFPVEARKAIADHLKFSLES
ncbi:hypothetical protein Sme01_23120 [Sphaerisporangium melleum]|uniref:HNH endonuclease n=1 Tax=Sphaerisporangium melleum TaxID=321316 RepID=A0A917VGH9_9ACTN|nr:hypothetical protein [Sphaerisporangium melleum]GGK78244.1 hypothetical protein GCM10007964_21250 [Sphaerisporangium melleum]GII69836.1 hypothetical protein Sme01_23120 [Sphaerisporangium melleum]